MSILERIDGHADLLKLTDRERECLCQEIRSFLVSSLAKTGGHLASNLGVVELSVAVETVFNTAQDRLVFDVGHQSYVHKLLTGRRADFSALRQYGGMAGFPKPEESNTDAFVAGHASSSVSVALGMARARTLVGDSYEVVALVGDGAATGGMVYEGLNDAAVSKEPMVIILNDNAMSIDRNVGGMSRHLSALRTKQSYLGMKQHYREFLARFPGGKRVYRLTRSIKDWVRRALIPSTIFESMGLTYLGPVDGHDVNHLISLLRTAKDMRRPVLVHVMTHKGHGYQPAEKNPSKFHGIGKFDPSTGEMQKASGETFSGAFGETMCQLAQINDKLCAITAAMPSGTGLMPFKHYYPKRLFDVGIAEEHAVAMAGGMAKQGLIPVVAIYSTFLQRAYDMIFQDVTMLKLHVVFAVDRAGLVGEDGETHHGVFDVGFLRQAPGMTVLCPVCCQELKDMLRWAVEEQTGPVALRYPRGADRRICESAWSQGPRALVCHRTGRDVTLITYGTLTDNALAAAELLAQQGIEATVLRLPGITDLPVAEIIGQLSEEKRIMILEEVCTDGGIRESLAWELRKYLPDCKIAGIDLGHDFITHGSVDALYRHCGLDPKAICEKTKEVLCDEN